MAPDSITEFQNETLKEHCKKLATIISDDPHMQEEIASKMHAKQEEVSTICKDLTSDVEAIERSEIRFFGAENGIGFKERKLELWSKILKNTNEYFFERDTIIPGTETKFTHFAIKMELVAEISVSNGTGYTNSKMLYICEPNFKDTLDFPNSVVLGSDEKASDILREVRPKELFEFYLKHRLIVNEYGIAITDPNVFTKLTSEDTLFFWKFYPIAWLGGLYSELRKWVERGKREVA